MRWQMEKHEVESGDKSAGKCRSVAWKVDKSGVVSGEA